MTIGTELEVQILRYYTKLRSGAVAPSRASCTSAATVQRVLGQAGLPQIGPVLRPSKIDAYLPIHL